jgi:hypothetical protein
VRVADPENELEVGDAVAIGVALEEPGGIALAFDSRLALLVGERVLGSSVSIRLIASLKSP